MAIRSHGVIPIWMFLGISLLAPRLDAQRQTQLTLSGGVATDQRGVRSNAVSLAPSAVFAPASNASLTASASATRFATGSWSLGVAGGFSGRDAIADAAALTLNASASGSRLRGEADASFAAADIMPALELRLGALTAFAGARAAAGYFTETVRQPGLPLGGGGSTQTASSSRVGAGPLYGATAVVEADSATLQLGAREDRMRVSGGVAIVDRTATAGIRARRIAVSVAGGHRHASDERGAFASGALSLMLRDDVSLDFAAGRYPANRLMGTPGGDYVSAGLSLRFGTSDEPRLPSTRGAPAPARGMTRLAIRADDARSVEVAGDFTEWKPVPATRATNGVWHVDLAIPAGQYRYAFRINGSEWRVPHGATAVDDGFGGKTAWITVREPGSG